MIPWAHPNQPAERHLDRFSPFCRAYKRDQHTHTHTHTPMHTERPCTLLRVAMVRILRSACDAR